MRIFVVRTSGQIAVPLAERAAKRGIELISVGRPNLYLSARSAFPTFIDSVCPNVLINATKYTAADRADARRD
ncbi:MAG: sugar nucleotide-binding protein [Candidatus Binatia bacterium]